MTKTFPAHHTHTHTPHSCPPHTRLGTYLRQLPSRPLPCPAGDDHVPGPSASQPMELTQRRLYLEPSNKDLQLRLLCPDQKTLFSALIQRSVPPMPRRLSPAPLAHGPWDRRDLLPRAPRAGRRAQRLCSSPWPHVLGRGTAGEPCFLEFGPLVLLWLSDQRLDCYFHLAFLKFLLKKNLIGIKLLYNIVLVSTVK